jgi:beta propeller repeat protein
MRGWYFLVGVFFTIVFFGMNAEADFDCWPVCTHEAGQLSPDVFGDMIIWVDSRVGLSYPKIYGYDVSLPTANGYMLWDSAIKQEQARIDGNLVVWRNGSSTGNYDIYASDSNGSTGGYLVFGGTSDQQWPAVSGDYVVWRDERNGNSDIYGIDLSGGSELAICTDSNGQYYPDIDGDVVVWMDMRNGASDIYGCDISGGEVSEFAICTAAGGQWYPRISGNVVVWQDDSNDGGDIYGCYLPDGEPFEICVHEGIQAQPVVYGDFVVWEDGRDAAVSGYDIYGYDLLGGVEIAICTGTLDQQRPAIFGDLIVWQDSSGAGDIYMSRRPSEGTLRLVWPNGGEELMAETVEEIIWESEGDICNVRIEYSSDAGANWGVIEGIAVNSGSYEWDGVLAVDSNECRVRISDLGNSGVYDESDGNFTIFICDPNLTGDIVKDCVVDILDFAVLAGQWLENGRAKGGN